MPLSREWMDPLVSEGVAELSELANFDGTPREFWPKFLNSLGKVSGSHTSLLYIQSMTDDGESTPWKRIAQWQRPDAPPLVRLTKPVDAAVDTIAAHALEHDGCVMEIGEIDKSEDNPKNRNETALFAFQPRLHQSGEQCLVVLLARGQGEAAAADSLVRLQIAASVPESFQRRMESRRAGEDVKKIATAMDLAVLVNQETKYIAAALSYCNGVAAHLRCDRVSLGWLQGGLIKLKAMSRTEKFDRKMEAAQLLEAAMDECLDQDDEITWPPDSDNQNITRDHERFAKSEDPGHLASIPLRVDDDCIGVITCERAEPPFTEVELHQLRLASDVAARRLDDLKDRDRWFGARFASGFRKQCGKLLGPTHTWAKLAAILTAVALAFLIFFKAPYRVEANFTLRSNEVSYLTSPIDGFIGEVHVRSGDTVTAGAPLLTLSQTDLRLEKSAANADYVRNLQEAKKARGDSNLAQMRIAEAMADQAKARLDLVAHRLSQSNILAPFDAIVVEGDQRERIGAPVGRGDVLFRLARIDNVYVEAKVDERDIHEVSGRENGQIAFVSRPADRFDVTIERIVPAAVPEQEVNSFIVRCEFIDPPADWAKPGMSGVCKLSVEKRSLGWILTHRTVDYLRMFFWW